MILVYIYMARKSDTELKLANAFIESRFTLEAMEIKLLYAIAYKLQNGDKGLNTIDLLKDKNDNAIYYSANEMTDFLGISKNSYKHFYRICNSLMSKNITLKNDTSQKFKILSFLIEAEYENGILKLVPNPYTKQFYMNLVDNYTRLELMQVLQLKSTYAIRIYSFIKKKAQQNRNACLFKLDEFKNMLGLEKLYSGKYGNNDFRRRVLLPAMEELNKVIPNLCFDFDLIKIGKSYKQVRFTFNGDALVYRVVDDDLYFKTFDKFRNQCNIGQYCNADESPECRYCKLKIKNRYE